MKKIATPFWIYYIDDEIPRFNPDKCGKWMYFYRDFDASPICEKAIQEHVVKECKHSNAFDGVCCFYLEDDDIDTHKKVIQYFIDNNLIRRTKTGKLYNISFKHDSETLSGKYGKNYHPDIKLERFIDLNTGKWLDETNKTYKQYLSDVRYDFANLKTVPIEFRDAKLCTVAVAFHMNWCLDKHNSKKASIAYLNKKELSEFISLIPSSSYSFGLCRQLILELEEKALKYIPREALTNDVLICMVENKPKSVVAIPEELRTDKLMESLLQIRGVKTALKNEKKANKGKS